MARYIPPHPKKGSAEAKAWGKRMTALRKKKFQKGYGRPRSSFDYGREYAEFLQAEQLEEAHTVDIERMLGGSVDIPPGDYQAMRTAGIEPNARDYWKGFNSLFVEKNPGAAWHETEAMSAAEQAARVTPGSRAASFYIGKRAAHTESAIESGARGMNPRRPKPYQKRRRIEMTYELAMAAGKDAGNYSMRKDGRTHWNQKDWNVMARTVNKLWPISKNPRRRSEYDVPTQHQIKIARSTLKMSDAGARIMGGMTKDQARTLLKRLGLYTRDIKRIDEVPERNPRRPHGTFRSCVRQVKKSLKQYDRHGDPKKICGAALAKKNPIAIYNKPKAWYLGRARTKQLLMKVFQAWRTPTQHSHGHQFKYVEGPFRSKQAAVDHAHWLGFTKVVNPNPVLPMRNIQVRYTRHGGQHHGEQFEHRYSPSVRARGEQTGKICFESPKGKKLWGA